MKNVIKPGDYTMWGAAQTVHLLGEGVYVVSTAGHGGIKVFPEQNAQIPEPWRQPGGWYEEDCDWCIPALIFPGCFQESLEGARKTAKQWHPELYMYITGEQLTSEDSYMLKIDATPDDKLHQLFKSDRVQVLEKYKTFLRQDS